MALLKDVNLTKQLFHTVNLFYYLLLLDPTLLKPYVGSRRDYLDIVYISLTSTAMSVDHDSIHSTTFTYVKLQCGNYFSLRKKRSDKTDERICNIYPSRIFRTPGRSIFSISSTTLFDRIHDRGSEEETPSVLIA